MSLFHLGGLTVMYPLNFLLISCLKQFPEKFEPDVTIKSVYGIFPPAIWNGGRDELGLTNSEQVDAVFNMLDMAGVSIRFTFTSTLITREMLDDPFCNYLCERSSHLKTKPAVIVNSDILENYIREKYPHFDIISSTCKCIRNGEDVDRELAKDYSLVVLDYNYCNDFEFLKSIKQKERIELLINCGCVPNCPVRKKHYEFHSQQQIDFNEHIKTKHWNTFDKGDFAGPCGFKINPFDAMKHSTFVNREDLFGKYIPMGFNNFKLEGRTGHPIGVLEYYLYYFAKPEYRDELRFEFIDRLIQMGVFAINAVKL
jgi:collagenase-like PrtC family protease